MSYASIDNTLFEFTPPEGAKVVHKTLNVPAGLGAEKPGAAESSQPGAASAGDEAAHAGAGAREGRFHSGRSHRTRRCPSPAPPWSPLRNGGSPTAILHYGKGFGSVLLVETQATADQVAQLQKQLGQLSKVQLVQPTMVNGSPGLAFSTSLFNVVAWQQGKLTVVAAGMVPQSDLSAFANSVQ